MKLTEIQELIKFVSKSGVSEVDIEKKDFKISIKSEGKKRKNEIETVYIPQPQAPQYQVAAPPVAPVAPVAPVVPETEEVDNTITIKAQMIGTFYRKPTPDSPSFVEVGDTIKEGDEICIIEAMKLYNKIEAEISGKIVKVLVDDGTPVEFDQPLFLVEPS